MATQLEQSAEYLFLSKDKSAIAVTCYENERPLQGLVGLLDWRFHGMISQFIRAGVITGKKGEIVYIPAKKQNRHYHLFLVGGGLAPKIGARSTTPANLLEELVSNIKAVGAEHWVISDSDFGNIGEKELASKIGKKLQATKGGKGIHLWIAN